MSSSALQQNLAEMLRRNNVNIVKENNDEEAVNNGAAAAADDERRDTAAILVFGEANVNNSDNVAEKGAKSTHLSSIAKSNM